MSENKLFALFKAVDCQWSNWNYGGCSMPCGTGWQNMYRTKLVVEKNGGSCTGDSSRVEECNNHTCSK